MWTIIGSAQDMDTTKDLQPKQTFICLLLYPFTNNNNNAGAFTQSHRL